MDGHEFDVTSEGDLTTPLEPPDLARPGAMRAVRKVVEHVLAMTDDDGADEPADSKHNLSVDPDGDSGAGLGVA